MIPLTDATATYSQTDAGSAFLVSAAIDGITTGINGWAIDGIGHPIPGAQTAVFHTAVNANLNGPVTFRLIQDYWNIVYGSETDQLGRFRISYTTADRSLFADGLPSGGKIGPDSIWQPITFSSFTCYYRDGIKADPGTTCSFLGDASLLIGGNNHRGSYVLASDILANSVTGFRIEAMLDPSLPHNGPGREPSNGNFVLTEFQVSVIPEPSSSVLILIAGALMVMRSFAKGNAKTRMP